MMERVPEVKEDDPISAKAWNTLARGVNRLSNLTVEAPLEMHHGAGGPVISLAADVQLVFFKLSTDASGGGKYNCKSIALKRSGITGTGTLAEADIGTVSTTEDVLALNLREVGQSTHDLDAAGFLPLIFWGYQTGVSTDGKRVVVFDGLQWEDC